MKQVTFISQAKFACFCAFIVGPSTLFASDLVLQKAPPLTVEQAPAYPENLARFHFGAQLKTSSNNNSAAKVELSMLGADTNASGAALLCDDPTIGYQLPKGKSTILVSLANIENIGSISFSDEGAKGSLTIAVSNADVAADSPEWRNVNQSTISGPALFAPIGPGEAKYVRLSFDLTAPGRIADFGVYAIPAVSDFTMPRPRKVSFENESGTFASINNSFTDLHLRARALYASSGDLKQANKMIDGQPTTAYQFAVGDNEPTAIIDLGRERNLNRISALYAAQPGIIDFYVLKNIPAGQPNDDSASAAAVQKVSNLELRADLPASLKLTEKDLSNLKPTGSVASTGNGRVSVNFPATSGRYIMLKWHPATLQGEAFSVAQVAAFGTHKPQDVTPTPAAEESASSADGKEAGDAKDLADGKNILDNKEIPAEGPAEAQPPGEGPPPPLPDVPPFTFIPQTPRPEVQPTSP
ncbi:MAG TPA: hypothetical protein VGG02_12115 [Chthoniobacterales bacterium]